MTQIASAGLARPGALAARGLSKIPRFKSSCLILLAVLASLVFEGCATQMSTSPLIDVRQDPDVDCSRYRTFCLYRFAGTDPNIRVDPITEKQILYLVRDHLVGSGYIYQDSCANADLVVTVYFSNEYKEQYIPPTSIPIPVYKPGQTVSFSGFFGSDYYYGSGRTSGSWTVETLTMPGRVKGYYYPVILVDLFDRATDDLVWSGSGVTSVDRGAFILHAGALVEKIMALFPRQGGMYSGEDALPGIAQLSVDSYPKGATVRVDGGVQGVTPTFVKVSEGNHTVSIGLLGYQPWEEEIAVARGGRSFVTAGLRPQSGRILVNSTPSDALVRIDGLLVGNTPELSVDLPIGTHKVEISKQGYETRRYRSVTLSDKSDLRIEDNLRGKTATRGMFRSIVAPGWGQMYLERPKMGVVTSAVQAGLLAFYVKSVMDYNRSVDDYSAVVDQYEHATDPNEVARLSDRMISAHQDVKDRHRQANYLLVGSIGVYGANILSCLFVGPSADEMLGASHSSTSVFAGFRPCAEIRHGRINAKLSVMF